MPRVLLVVPLAQPRQPARPETAHVVGACSGPPCGVRALEEHRGRSLLALKARTRAATFEERRRRRFASVRKA